MLLYQVVKRDLQNDRLIVKSMSDTTQNIEIIPKMMSALSVYHQHEAELSVGDNVRVTRNNAELDLANGDRYEVLRVNETSVTIGLDGRAITLPADQLLHIDHAYATIAHSAQGLTCDRVCYNAESTSRTTAQDTYYVSISRERHDVVVFTDNALKLPDAVARIPYKGLAHDLVQTKMGYGKLETSNLERSPRRREMEFM